ncbi:MAG: hypothetical protein R3C10_11610 [Pirellulales bacterium]
MTSRLLPTRCVTALLLAVLLVAPTGCGNSQNAGSPGASASQAGSGRIVVLMNGNSPFWDTMRAGINAAAKEFGVEASLETNDATPKGQIDKLRQFASQSDIAAVAISATDAANPAIADEMRNLRERRQGDHRRLGHRSGEVPRRPLRLRRHRQLRRRS